MQPDCIFLPRVLAATARRRSSTVAAGLLAGVLTLLLCLQWAGVSNAAARGIGPRSDAPRTPTVWLCRPGLAQDPCTAPLRATVIAAGGPRTVRAGQPDSHSRFDCFYVYPTVSSEPADNSDLTVQSGEVAAAVSQASRFSQVCRVWAPMYRQRTESSLFKGLGGDPHADAVAYASVLSAWRDYLANDNHGRPVIFIGHSQGAAMLIRLLASQSIPTRRCERELSSRSSPAATSRCPPARRSVRRSSTCRCARRAQRSDA